MAIGSRLRGILDELISTGYPEQVAARIASGDLPMDTASRMQRAEAMGFDPSNVAYHGTRADIAEFEPSARGKMGPGIYTSPSPVIAGSYSTPGHRIPRSGVYDDRGLLDEELLVSEGANVMPLLLRGDRMERFEALKQNPDIPIAKLSEPTTEGASELATRLEREGITGLEIQGSGSDGMRSYNVREQNTFDPRNVRSLFAAFDPEYKGSNILGDRAVPVAGAGLLAAAALAPEEAEAGVIKTFGREFDPRFDKRTLEQEKLRDTTYTIEERGTQDAPRIALSDLEGRPFVTTMSDRTQAGGLLTDINDVALDRPINLQGGQGFMFENPGMTWASAPGVVTQIMKEAKKTGEDPLYMPFRMAPTGGDFATMTGETMLSYASANMAKSTKNELDKAITEFVSKGSVSKGVRKNDGLKIKGWKGVDDPRSVEAFRNAPDPLRKELMNMIDVKFRNKGGLSIGQARLAVTEPGQADALDARIQNIGEIFSNNDVITQSGHPSYPQGVPGQGLGRTDQEVSIFELLPDARYGDAQKPVKDPQRPTAREIRALSMKPYAGRITEDLLMGLEARGVNVNANPLVTAAAVSAGTKLEGLLSQLPQKDEEGYSYGDLLPIKRALDPEQREGLLGGYSPAYTGIVEDLVEGLLTFKTQAERGLYNPTAATEFLL